MRTVPFQFRNRSLVGFQFFPVGGPMVNISCYVFLSCNYTENRFEFAVVCFDGNSIYKIMIFHRCSRESMLLTSENRWHYSSEAPPTQVLPGYGWHRRKSHPISHPNAHSATSPNAPTFVYIRNRSGIITDTHIIRRASISRRPRRPYWLLEHWKNNVTLSRIENRCRLSSPVDLGMKSYLRTLYFWNISMDLAVAVAGESQFYSISA